MYGMSMQAVGGLEPGQEARRRQAETQGAQVMAVLTANRRNSLPKASFGLPKQRKFPMPDKVHAVAAKGSEPLRA